MKTITLNNGVEMPLQGFGVFQIAPQDCEAAVRSALDVGYRMIDTAQAYYNEVAVGRAWRTSGIAREDLFLVTKVWISNAGDERAAKSIDESLRKLETEYIDLLLIHQAFGDYYGTYRAMQKALEAGKVRAIGLSNFVDARFVDLVENMEVKPAVLQLETHVFSQQKRMRELMAPYGTRLMGLGAACRRQKRHLYASYVNGNRCKVRQDGSSDGTALFDGRGRHRDSEVGAPRTSRRELLD